MVSVRRRHDQLPLHPVQPIPRGPAPHRSARRKSLRAQLPRRARPRLHTVGDRHASWLTDVATLMIIYHAFIEGELEAPKHLDRKVHNFYFNPTVEEFQPRTLWSLSNAFTSAFKE